MSKLRGNFRREYDEKFSREIFKIGSRYKRGSRPVYRLFEWDGTTPIKGTFHPEELQKVTVTSDRRYKVYKLLKKRKKGRETLAQFLGWPAKYAAWVPTADLTG